MNNGKGIFVYVVTGFNSMTGERIEERWYAEQNAISHWVTLLTDPRVRNVAIDYVPDNC